MNKNSSWCLLSFKIAITFYLIVTATIVYGQNGNDTATVVKKSNWFFAGSSKLSTRNDTYFYRNEPEVRYAIDSTIATIHRYNWIYNDREEYLNLGNTGSAAYSVIFSPKYYNGFNLGYRQYEPYQFTRDSIKFYQVVRPYTELTLSLGLNKETVVNVRFANSHKKTLSYGIEYSRSNLKGKYTNQYNQNDCFSFYGKYTSKNNLLDVGTDFLLNHFLSNDNGGTRKNYLQQDSVFFQPSLTPVNTNSGKSVYLNIDWHLYTQLNLGKKINVRINDSTLQKKVVPLFSLEYDFGYANSKNQFQDLTPDSIYYHQFFNHDSLSINLRYHTISNAFNFCFSPTKTTSDSTYREAPFFVNATLGLDYILANQRLLSLHYPNAYIKGEVRSNRNRNKFFNYAASVWYFFAGYNQNDLRVEGNVQLDLNKIGRLKAAVNYYLQAPDYIYQSFNTDSFQWKNNFAKSNLLRFGGAYFFAHPIVSLQADIYNHVLKNIFYFDEKWTPQVAANATNVLVIHAANRLGIKGFHLDNDIWYQQINGSSVIPLPKFVLKTSVYYERRLFKKALWLAIGSDLRYYSSTALYGYTPLFGQFYIQNQSSSFYPVWDIFLNAKIKSVRISLLGNNLTQLMTKNQKSYYTAALYPMQNASFVFTVKWRFFE